MVNLRNDAAPDRLSVSEPKKAPPREFTVEEMDILRRIADTLIPAGDGVISGGSIRDFENLVTRAAAILDKSFPNIITALEVLGPVPQVELWPALQVFAAKHEPAFSAISTLISGAYLYSSEVISELKYPVPHSNAPGMFDVVEELSSGILDKVMGSAFTYIRAD